jgi:hypothetical protein
LGKTAAECSIELHGNGLAQAAEISDYRHCILLRAGRERPSCRAELAPFQLIELDTLPLAGDSVTE